MAVVLLGKEVDLHLYEDNQSTAQMIEAGKFATLRHVQRTHGISIAWLADCRDNIFSQ